MKLEKWALIAEVVGGVAIVVSLIVLILEVRGTTNAIQIANRQSLATRGQELALFLSEHPEVSRALRNARDGSDVSADELDRAINFVVANLRVAEEAYLLFQNGDLDEQYWQTRAALALGNFSSNGTMREAYATRRDQGWFAKDFTDWLDQALEESYGQ